jgi:hypothetical protein
VDGLVDHHVGQRHEDLVEESGSAEGAQDLFTPLAGQVAYSAIGEQALVSPTEALRLQHRLDENVDVDGTARGQRGRSARRPNDDDVYAGRAEDGQPGVEAASR